MSKNLQIRESLPGETAIIETLYPAAFPGEELRPLVEELLRELPPVRSLVAVIDRDVVGHVIFATCGIVGHAENVSLLGPLAAAPEHQRKGVGSALVRKGLQQLKIAGLSHVYVLGDPAYYKRAGSLHEIGVVPPFPLPDEWHGAWQSHCLNKAARSPEGQLRVPQSWDRAALWAP